MDDPANRIPSPFDQTRRYDTNPRMIVVAFAGNEGGGFRLAASDDKLIPRLDNPNQDDPFDSIAIANGSLKLKMRLFMSMGGWEMNDTSFTFRWIDERFRLIGFDRNSTMRNSGRTENTSINYLTGRKVVTTGSIDGRADRPKTTRLPKKPLLKMGQVVDGLSFDPDAQLIDCLDKPMAGEDCRAELFAEHHRAALKAACAEDPDIWAIYRQ